MNTLSRRPAGRDGPVTLALRALVPAQALVIRDGERRNANPDMVNAILEEGAKFCEQVLAPLNRVGDIEGCTWSENAARQLSVPERANFRTWLATKGINLAGFTLRSLDGSLLRAIDAAGIVSHSSFSRLGSL